MRKFCSPSALTQHAPMRYNWACCNTGCKRKRAASEIISLLKKNHWMKKWKCKTFREVRTYGQNMQCSLLYSLYYSQCSLTGLDELVQSIFGPRDWLKVKYSDQTHDVSSEAYQQNETHLVEPVLRELKGQELQIGQHICNAKTDHSQLKLQQEHYKDD